MNIDQRFLDQNELAAQTLTIEDVEDYAEHHSGGLIVLGQMLPGGRYMKMHDSWGDEGTVVVHEYNPEDVDDSDIVEHFKTGAAALARFLAAPRRLPTLTVREIVTALQQFDQDKPVLVYDEAAGWYRNVRLVEMHDEDMAVNIGASDDYDTRQW